MRPVVGTIIICLPLAQLQVTSILSIVMALIVLCLIWENVTSLKCNSHIFQRWQNTKYPSVDISSEPGEVPKDVGPHP